MKKFLKTYKTTIILLAAIIVGTIVGLIAKENAAVLKPFGDIFLNLLLVIIVPLIFLTITTSIARMKSAKRVGKIIVTIFIVFIATSLISVLVGMGAASMTKLVEPEDTEVIKTAMEEPTEEAEDLTIADRTVQLITVDDFQKLFTRGNIIAILVASIITGIACQMSGKKGEAFVKVLESANDVVQNIIKIIMYYAPIGLGCYFAYMIGTFGASIAVGYLKTFLIYTAVCVGFYFIMYTIYAFIGGGKLGVKKFWKNAAAPTLTSLATCSSAASIPVNTDAAKKIGVPEDVADTTIPMGCSFHKDGSIIGSVFKIMFLVCIFGTSFNFWQILGVALLANLLITGVPIGGGTISEMLIITMLGFPVAALPLLTVVATIIDPPATMLNVVGDTVSSMMVARITDGKNWIKEAKTETVEAESEEKVEEKETKKVKSKK